ncbi:TetR family transcriptional regulator [Streptacidiphilus sp. N1-12]|uniref:TetR family transcriptional regulator n=2 Tax=Streptacidiphilus alkalitolerans TaxID=3342712 RepID=A0ABV6WQT9_9ACTN
MATPRTETRSRVLRTAATLFRRQGYHATGLNQLLAESSAPKGSLYFHFPGGKEQLAAEAVLLSARDLGTQMGEAMDAASAAASPSGAGAEAAAAAIAALGNLFAESLESSGYLEGCPIATVALETASANADIRSACARSYAAWQTGLAKRMRGWGVPQDEADPLAELVLAGLQGALLLARVRQDAALVRQIADRLGAQVAAAATAATATGSATRDN